MKSIITFILFIGVNWTVGAQAPLKSLCQEKMQAMAVMEGTWTGAGWTVGQDGVRSDFTQKEVLSFDLNRTVLHIKGKGFNENNELIHHALGILSYDAESQKYHMNSFLETGQQIDAGFKITGPGQFEWGFEVPQGKIRYQITIENDTWTEKGDFSRDGETWYPFIEFTLKKES